MKIASRFLGFSLLILALLYTSCVVSATEQFRKEFIIDGENTLRNSDETIYYSYDKYPNGSKQNEWGYEIAVDSDGYICEINPLVRMPKNGFIISAHSKEYKFIFSGELKIGDIVTYNNMKATVVRDEKLSNRYSAKSNFSLLQKEYSTIKNSLLDVDYKGIDENIVKITESLEGIDDYSVSELQKLNKLIEDTTYMCMPSNKLSGNAIWHRPMATTSLATVYNEKTLKGVTDFLDDLQASGINTVFLETYRESFLSFPSVYTDGSNKLFNMYHGSFMGCNYGEYGNDYTLAFIKEAHKRGIEVHAWTETFLAYVKGAAKPAHIKNDWLIEFYNGTNFSFNLAFLDPSNEEVLDYLTWIYDEVMKYDFDGIQFDYIRYSDVYVPGHVNSTLDGDPGYNDISANSFKEEYGYSGDLRTIITKSGVRDDFNEFRTDNITKAFTRFRNQINDKNKEFVISISVGSNPEEAKKVLMQDYSGWITNNLVDLVCPMVYVSDTSLLQTLAKSIANICNNKTFQYTGISPIYDGFNIKLNQEQVNAIKKSNTNGYTLFASFNYFGETNYENELKLSSNRLDSITPLSDANTVYKTSLEHFKDQLEYIYLYNNVVTEEEVEVIKTTINSVIDSKNNNPLQMQESIKKLSSLEFKTKSMSAKVAMNKYIEELINTLDIKISRELVKDGHWEGSGSRPTITGDMYDINETVNDNDDDVVIESDNNIVVPVIIISSVVAISVSLLVILFKLKRKK